MSGSIRHDTRDDKFELSDGTYINDDAIIEFTFEVLFAPEESHFNFGLWLDTAEHGAFHIIEIDSLFGGSFCLWSTTEEDEYLLGGIGEDAPSLNLEKGDKNHVRVLLLGQKAGLFINDRHMGVLDLTHGDIPPPN